MISEDILRWMREFEDLPAPPVEPGTSEWYRRYPRGAGVRQPDGKVIWMTHCLDLPN